MKTEKKTPEHLIKHSLYPTGVCYFMLLNICYQLNDVDIYSNLIIRTSRVVAENYNFVWQWFLEHLSFSRNFFSLNFIENN